MKRKKVKQEKSRKQKQKQRRKRRTLDLNPPPLATPSVTTAKDEKDDDALLLKARTMPSVDAMPPRKRAMGGFFGGEMGGVHPRGL